MRWQLFVEIFAGQIVIFEGLLKLQVPQCVCGRIDVVREHHPMRMVVMEVLRGEVLRAVVVQGGRGEGVRGGDG